MELDHFELSSAGFVHKINEDTVVYWQPKDEEERQSRGAVAIVADGLGGQGDGDVASRMAVHVALQRFIAAKPDTPPSRVLWQMFADANLAVYDAAMASGKAKRMATTMTAVILRNDQVFIGHVGDCRVYHIQGQKATRLTSDHSYTGVQLKLGLIDVHEAANSELRCVLTRSLGQDAVIRADYNTVTVNPGDFLVLCSDGLYCCMSEQEMIEIVTRWPEMACNELQALVERRKGEDNFSVQILHVRSVERVSYYRGQATYRKVADPSMGQGIEVGEVLDDRFQITDIISKSGMATIFKATDLKTNGTVALKVPLMKYESDPGFYSRFQREEEIGLKLRHPYILRIEPVEGEKSRPYFVMEYLEGQTLGHLMKSVRPMPIHDALQIASRVCEALAYLHENNIVHRDLKPDNIMICNDGTIRIMDFGIAKQEGARRLTFGGFQPAMGTPDYMAPEQVKGKRGDARTDIYSLGAILYEMITGTPPFEGGNPLVIMNARLSGDPVAPSKKNAQITPEVEEIVLKAMARDLEDRYPSAKALKEDLDDPKRVQVTGRAQRLVKPSAVKSRWKRYRFAILAVVVPVVLFLIVWVATHIRLTIK